MRIAVIVALVLALGPSAVRAQPVSPQAPAGFTCETLAHRQMLGGSPPITARVLKQTYATGKVPVMHRHKVGEILYILSGSGTNTMDGKTTALSPDHAIIIPAGTEHALAGTGSAGLTVVSVQVSDTKSPWFKVRNNKKLKACSD